MLAKIPLINPPICAELSMPGTMKPKIIVAIENPKAPQNNQRNSRGVMALCSRHKKVSKAP